jgi:hypothetical protein
MAEYCPAILYAARLRIPQPKLLPIIVSALETFHFDSKEARGDFLRMMVEANIAHTVIHCWELKPPRRSLADDAFEQAKKLSEQDR